jgi:uroporphyrinogen-III synthase
MEALIRRYHGEPFIAPSVKEIPLEANEHVFGWAERLFGGEFDMAIFMTGVGLGYLRDAVLTRFPRSLLVDALRPLTIVSRGPKPQVLLDELGVKPQIRIPEPNTWREIVPVIAGRSERRITIQEYGRPNVEFTRALEALGARVTPVAIYRWALPDDLGALREAVRRIATRACDVVVFTTSIQLTHLLEVAVETDMLRQVKESLAEDLVIASVGPIMNAALTGHGLEPDVVPPHPKMGILVRHAAVQSAAVLARKRQLTAR